MSGECETCEEHTLDCLCKAALQYKKFKCPKKVPVEIFEELICNEVLSLSYLIRKLNISEKTSRKILLNLSKLCKFIDYDDIGPIRIKICEKPKKMQIFNPSPHMQELDGYLKTMCKAKKPSRLYDDMGNSSQYNRNGYRDRINATKSILSDAI